MQEDGSALPQQQETEDLENVEDRCEYNGVDMLIIII